MSKRTCPICKTEYDDGGNAWKKICYDCYKNYRYCKRIQPFGYKQDIYMTHPSVTKEELDAWIEQKGKVSWGAVEVTVDVLRKWKLWTASTNFD